MNDFAGMALLVGGLGGWAAPDGGMGYRNLEAIIHEIKN